MFGLIYKAVTYFFTGTTLNKGERDQPPPLDVQEEHFQKEIRRVRRERELLAERERLRQDLARGEDQP